MKFENVCFSYDKRNILFDQLSFSFGDHQRDRGSIVGLMGASGSGKTTLVKLLSGILRPQHGRILLHPEKPVLSYLPQEAVFFSHLSPLQNAVYFKHISAYKKHFDQKIFEQNAEVLNMTEILKTRRSMEELSGGQKQRIGLLRALSIKPNILIMDESLIGIDNIVKIDFMYQIREIVHQQKILGIYVCHNKDECDVLADELAYIHYNAKQQRNIIFQDDMQNFSSKPPILDAFRAFHYPRHCILSARIENNRLVPCSQSTEDAFYIAVKQENISFSKSNGFHYTLVSSSPRLALIEIYDKQYLTIDTFLCPTHGYHTLLLNGQVLKYSRNEEYIGEIRLIDNELR